MAKGTKTRKRSKKLDRPALQRSELVDVDLTGDSDEVARRRTDVFIRNILNYMPGDVTARIFIKVADSPDSSDEKLLEVMRNFVREYYSYHLTELGELRFVPNDSAGGGALEFRATLASTKTKS